MLDEELAIVRRPGQRRVIATRSALDEFCFLVARFLHVDVKPALLLAIGAEGDLLAVMTPTAERVNRFGMSGEIGARPAFTDAMVAAAGDAAQVIKLRALVAAGVHAVDDFMTDGTVVGAADAFARKRQLGRPAALGRHLPELGDAGDVGQEGQEAAVGRKAGAGGGADIQELLNGRLR